MIKELLLKIIYSKYFLILLIVLIGFFSKYLLGDDNPIEEYSEEIIKEETGIDIDLTPNSMKTHSRESSINYTK
jgi:hypothetical protein